MVQGNLVPDEQTLVSFCNKQMTFKSQFSFSNIKIRYQAFQNNKFYLFPRYIEPYTVTQSLGQKLSAKFLLTIWWKQKVDFFQIYLILYEHKGVIELCLDYHKLLLIIKQLS